MEKIKSVVIVVLVILVIALGGILIYSNVNSNNDNDVNINNENNNGNESVNNNDEDNTNIYGDIKQLYPTLLEVSTSECSQYISQEELDYYAEWIHGLPVDEEKEKKFKNIPEDIKNALDYFGLLQFSTAPSGVEDRYTATRELKENENTFFVNNLRVRNFDKAWSEAAEGVGIGEKIKYEYVFLRSYNIQNESGEYISTLLSEDKLTMHELCDIQYNYLKDTTSDSDLYDEIDNCYFSTSEIIIENGYCKTKELWEKNGRVKTLKLTFEDGEKYILNLKDTMKPQSFKLEHRTKGIQVPLEATFEILDVYEGTTYQDTCITTLELKCDGYGIHKGY